MGDRNGAIGVARNSAGDDGAHPTDACGRLAVRTAASAVPLLYGGSVNAGNIGGYLSQPDINGALVGGASLDAGSFVEIVKVAAEATG